MMRINWLTARTQRPVMPFSRRSPIILTTVALSLLLAVPAAASTVSPASVPSPAHPRDAVPADCTVRGVAGTLKLTMTCTARPAGQQWQLGAACILDYPYKYDYKYGNIVTGDGTSTIPDCPGPIDVVFDPVS